MEEGRQRLSDDAEPVIGRASRGPLASPENHEYHEMIYPVLKTIKRPYLFFQHSMQMEKSISSDQQREGWS